MGSLSRGVVSHGIDIRQGNQFAVVEREVALLEPEGILRRKSAHRGLQLGSKNRRKLGPILLPQQPLRGQACDRDVERGKAAPSHGAQPSLVGLQKSRVVDHIERLRLVGGYMLL